MDNDLNGFMSDVEDLNYVKNGVDSLMTNFLEGNNSIKEDSNQLEKKVSENDSCSSESDALVIDESFPKNQKKLKKVNSKHHTVVEDENGENNTLETLTHSNPFFNKSLFELSQLHQNYEKVDDFKDCVDDTVSKYKRGKNKPKGRLQEYAQYLGLQPAIQFKCSKCSRAGFETLTALQEHVSDCNEKNVQEITGNLSSGFKLTRKVFLCSACGTYYENWNLYMHMLEIHQRFICLYCLGMFSLLEDLCQHLQSKHNLQPGYKNSPDDFFNTYNEPCYLVCCECHKLFNEQDNFFYHNCNKNSVKNKKMVKTQIAPENHVTGETEAIGNVFSDLDKVVEENKSCVENKNGIKFQETMETNSENLVSNKHISQDSNVTESIKDHVENHFEENGSLGEVIGHPEENLTIEPSYTDSKLELTRDETNCEPDFSKDISDKEQDMQEPEEVSQQGQSAFDKQLETRKVPKLSLKLPKPVMYMESAEDSDDSEKLMMDQVESDYDIEHDNSKDRLEHTTSDNENLEEHEEDYEEENEELNQEVENDFFKSYKEEKSVDNNKPKFQVAGLDVPVVELVLEQPLDKFDPHVLLQKCLKNTIQSCIYCNHARKIAVNGKQLALHCIAEHRFSAVVNSITAEELIPESFVNCFSESLDELNKSFFSLDSNFTNEAVTFSHLFECFQCYFSTTIHKELYLHNRKFHSKNLLLCIMCKSNFFSYSELICHLCPGVYVLDYDLQFRCCMCVNEDLPSSFRLMVHLRKKHNVCDVCLEMCHTQYRLSNHVWKHKLHHFCYRCGIAYRNKPDITRHLFWKHGTESVLCKKCLQKKWPHVYHFCVPPSSFTCDECGLNFTKAVSLKVHKRIHTNDKKHQCSVEGCLEKFISNKLRVKHEQIHYEPPKDLKLEEKVEDVEEKINGKVDPENDEQAKEVSEEKPKAKIDVLDVLPALNLSESDSSDSEIENLNTIPEQTIINKETVEGIESNTENDISLSNLEADIEKQEEEYKDGIKACEEEDEKQNKLDVLDEPDDVDHSNSVIQNIWDNFKNYQASKGKLDNIFIETEKTDDPPLDETNETEIIPEVFTFKDALRDHDYCLAPEQTTDTTLIEVKPALTESVDHDYCSPKVESVSEKTGSNNIENAEVEDINNIKIDSNETQNKTQSVNSSSSSDSDSSSCSCGSNCSCSSSSGSSSSSSNSSGSDSSTEEGRKRQQAARKQRRKDRAKKMKEIDKTAASEVIVAPKLTSVHPPVSADTPIQESDLETTESETDEEFYDKAPQKMAAKILEEKRQQLLSIMGPNNVPNGSFIESTSRPPTPPAGEIVEEEERKKKKSKSKKRKKHRNEKKEVAVVPVPSLDVPIPPYYQQFHQTFNQQPSEPPPPESPTNISVSTNFSVVSPSLPVTSYPKVQMEPLVTKQESSDSTLRASKRRRVPNKFYGYSSDEDQEKSHVAKWRKTESVTPRSPLIVPPITIKTTSHATPPPPPPQVVEPISIRTGAHLSEFRVQRPRPRPSSIPPIKLLSGMRNDDSASDSNDSSSEEHNNLPPKPAQPQLYCYCRCPYDEVSEMIGCDASDCAIEWFHFECVGIMVPPKGQWFCPDCRKKKQQKRDFFSSLSKSSNIN